mmetsp:Transcript_110430/g.219514  ORF Transcript_110430/g.219514 Transcript_110430/m.219514 type:complete len:124 (+) Transcript_110430:107-478(+)
MPHGSTIRETLKVRDHLLPRRCFHTAGLGVGWKIAGKHPPILVPPLMARCSEECACCLCWQLPHGPDHVDRRHQWESSFFFFAAAARPPVTNMLEVKLTTFPTLQNEPLADKPPAQGPPDAMQ